MTARRRNPWWIPPFLGRVPADLEDRHLNLLGAVSLALFFEEYDIAMLTAALKHIAADLGMPIHRRGLDLGLIQLGGMVAFLVIPFADRIGRRPVFVASLAAMGLLTFVTAFVQTPEQFIAMQAFTRAFFVAGTAVAFVIVAEEFPAAHRGWGMGMAAAIGAVGHGFGAIAFSQIERLPHGWRDLYGFGIAPLALLPFFLRRVGETTRFTAHARESGVNELGGLRGALVPLLALAGTHPWRAVGVALAGLCAAGAVLPSIRMSADYTQTKLGWEPQEYSLMVVAAGAVGIIGNIVAGRLGDVFGRRRTGFVLLSLFPLASALFYNGPGWAVVVAWVGLVFFSMGGRIILRALATELFPTAYRGAASGMFSVLETLGSAGGLFFLYFYGTTNIDDVSVATPLVALAIYVSAFVLLAFPETRRRELEDIS